jgi:hypothetical protein
MRAIIGRLGWGKVVHLISIVDAAVCGTRGGSVTPVDGPFSKVTCKRCLKIQLGMVALAEDAAYAEDARRELEVQLDTAAAAHVHGLTMTTIQRRAARRTQAAKLRAMTAQTRAAARARRVKRNGTPAPARTLLVAAGLSDALAERYAGAFSRGVETANPSTSKRIRTGAHRSKRVAVKLFTPAEFAERLATYRPKNAEHAAAFGLAA